MQQLHEPKSASFGDWRLDLESGQLIGQHETVQLAGKLQTLLQHFLANPDRLISRHELKEALWPRGTHVDFDNNLNTSLARLREMLGDSVRHPRYIETVPRRGYRWIGPKAVQASRPAEGAFPWKLASLAAGLLLSSSLLLFLGLSSAPSDRPQRIAVVPFEVLAGEDLEYLAQGLTWEVVTELVNWNPNQLEVLGQETAARLGSSPSSLADIQTDYILRGALQGGPQGRLRISVSLIRAEGQVNVWAQQFDRNQAEGLDLQQQIALSVMRALGLELPDRLPPASPSDPRARTAVLRARYLFSKKAEAQERQRNLQEAALQVGQALSIEPDLVEALLLASDIAMSRSSSDQIKQAHQWLAKALSLAGDHPGALIRRAQYRFGLHWDFEGAERDFQRALQLRPGDSWFHNAYAFYLSSRGRHDEAVSHLLRAFDLDPISAGVSGDLAWVYFQARRYQNAIDQANQTLLLEPDDRSAQMTILLSQRQLGRHSEAHETARSMMRTAELPESAKREVMTDASLSALWRAALKKLQEDSRSQHVHPAQFALMHSNLGDADKTLHFLQAAKQEPFCSYLPFLATDPRVDLLRGQEAFRQLIESVEGSSRPQSHLARMLLSDSPMP